MSDMGMRATENVEIRQGADRARRLDPPLSRATGRDGPLQRTPGAAQMTKTNAAGKKIGPYGAA